MTRKETTKSSRTRVDRESGAAMVEFALVLSLLMLLVLGIIDFGRAFNMQIALTQAAREGVRVLSLAGGTLADADLRTRQAAFPHDDGGLAVNLAGCPSTVTGTTPPAVVTVSHAFQFTGFLGLPSLTLTGKGEMRCNG